MTGRSEKQSLSSLATNLGEFLMGPASHADEQSEMPESTEPSRSSVASSIQTWLRPWKSSPDQPTWSRPLLLVIAFLAAFIYLWGIWDNELRSPFYGAAVYSMSQSWHAFFYGSFDTLSSISLDKIPAAFQIQALFVRIFGFHNWVLVLPQVLEGVLTVLILHRVVHRWVGPVAALLAALILTLTPIIAALDRSTQADTMLVLLLVLAADAWQRAVITGRLRFLMLCGVWLGLAFHAKMIQAWAILPAFGITYGIAAAGPLSRRFRHLAVASAVTLVVSSLWLMFVWLTPSTSRPYIDGTTNNSVVAMVFGHNLLSRLDVTRDLAANMGAIHLDAVTSDSGTSGWLTFLQPNMASQISWLLPLAVFSFILGLFWRRQESRTDLLRAGFLMWGIWLIIYIVAFSVGTVAHTFYSATLAPAIAALSGGGIAMFWKSLRDGDRIAWVLPAALLGTVAWATYLNLHYEGFLAWLVPPTLAFSAIALISILRAPFADRRRRFLLAGTVTSVAAMLIAPGAWTLSTLVAPYGGDYIGPSAGPTSTFGFGGEPRTKQAQYERAHPAISTYLRMHQGDAKYALAVKYADNAGPYIMDAHLNALPIGGFTGSTPFPTIAHLEEMVSSGQLRYVLDIGYGEPSSDGGSSPAMGWILQYCTAISPSAYGDKPSDSVSSNSSRQSSEIVRTLYDCAERRHTG